MGRVPGFSADACLLQPDTPARTMIKRCGSQQGGCKDDLQVTRASSRPEGKMGVKSQHLTFTFSKGAPVVSNISNGSFDLCCSMQLTLTEMD